MTEPIRITREQGGEVEVTGPYDAFVVGLLRRAGFLIQPALGGHWVRLPFDLGRDWENERATWAAEMLAAARYPVLLGPGLRHESPRPGIATARPPAMTMQAPPGRRCH
ncbi:hypothetical protein [Streptomyces sp. NPDC003247]|uniref:hypothetical protein n=1 Tax=Streptomyces sp. NPDC003247 TaxID=3364677 RepID=UPI00367EE008